jgi:TetR/AcrR family transcriptional regulator
MPDNQTKTNRRQQILESLVHMLEVNPGCRITTAALAKEVGVSEAALYRHFPSKFKMFEALIDYVEETIFSRVSTILKEHPGAKDRINHILTLMLTFTGRNPGITRILTGDALVGENNRLHARVAQLFDRLETQLKQILRDAELNEGLRPATTNGVAANLLMAVIEGRISQFVRSNFKKIPMENWPEQWQVVMTGFFRTV